MIRYQLNADEAAMSRALAKEVACTCASIEDEKFLAEAMTYAQELPHDLRSFLNSFRLFETDAACVVGGYPVDDNQIGPTPSHWTAGTAASRTLDVEIYFFLCACLLGDPIAWSTQQDGHIMHSVLPIKEHEWEQLGSGSRELLTWHTEEAFHPLRADYIGLMCLRNPDGVETTYATIEDVLSSSHLSAEVMSILREPIFSIRPDRSHLPVNRGSAELSGKRAELTEKCYAWISAMDTAPDKVAVLSGAEDLPYLRLDPYFMDLVYEDERAARALSQLCEEIEARIRGYALNRGETLFLDNYRAVHGRRAFEARFDGTDRWLKRLNVTRDLRKSRERRISSESRVLY